MYNDNMTICLAFYELNNTSLECFMLAYIQFFSSVRQAVFPHCCQYCPSCLAHLKHASWATWTVWAAIRNTASTLQIQQLKRSSKSGKLSVQCSYLADPTSPIPSHCDVIIVFKSVPVHCINCRD